MSRLRQRKYEIALVALRFRIDSVFAGLDYNTQPSALQVDDPALLLGLRCDFLNDRDVRDVDASQYV